MPDLKPITCKYEAGRHLNELGEEEVYCEFTARWMNVTLGDCIGNCEFGMQRRDDEQNGV